jgi:uncharacterized protein involved in outer membrane biogenesis
LGGLLVSQINISDGTLTYYDAGSPSMKEGVRVGSLNLSLEDVSLEKPIPFALSFGVDRDGTDIKLSGVLGPVGKELKVETVPLSLQVALEKFALKRVMKFVEEAAFMIDDGVLSVKADISGDLAQGLKISGVVDVASLTMSDPEKKEILMGLDTSINAVGNLSAEKAGKMQVNLDLSSPNLTLRLPKKTAARATENSFAQWLVPSAEAAVGKRSGAARRSGSSQGGGLDIQGKINVAKGTVGDIPFTELKGNYSKKGNLVRVSNFSVKGFGAQGSASGNMTMNLAGKLPTYQVELNASGIDMSTLQDMFAKRKERAEGELSAKLNLSGAGFDAKSIQNNLKGDGNFKVERGRLANVNLEKRVLSTIADKYGLPLGTLAQMAGVEIVEGDETPFEEFHGIFQIGSGQIRVQDSAITSRDHGFAAIGKVGLDQLLDLNAKMILRKVGDIKQKKFTYYLIDEKSRKYIPFRVSGKSSKPVVMVDMEALVKGQARQAVEEQKEKVKEKLREKLGPEGEEILKPLEKIFKF